MHEPMQDGGEKHAFKGKLEFPSFGDARYNPIDSQFAPKSFEKQRRADAPVTQGGRILGVELSEDREFVRESLHGAHERVDFPRLSQAVEPSEIGDDALDDFPLLALVFDDLEVGSIPARYAPDKHGRLLSFHYGV